MTLDLLLVVVIALAVGELLPDPDCEECDLSVPRLQSQGFGEVAECLLVFLSLSINERVYFFV